MTPYILLTIVPLLCVITIVAGMLLVYKFGGGTLTVKEALLGSLCGFDVFTVTAAEARAKFDEFERQDKPKLEARIQHVVQKNLRRVRWATFRKRNWATLTYGGLSNANHYDIVRKRLTQMGYRIAGYDGGCP